MADVQEEGQTEVDLPDDFDLPDDVFGGQLQDDGDGVDENRNPNGDRGGQHAGCVQSSRTKVPWELVATFSGLRCDREARNALTEHAGTQWFESKGTRKRDTQLAHGIPLAQTPRKNLDGTIVSEAKCPFFAVPACSLSNRLVRYTPA